jgi:hypothetical protein
MGVTVFAGKVETVENIGDVWAPVIPFQHWEKTVVAPDANARVERGESVFIENPNFVADAGLEMSSASATAVFDILGLQVDEDLVHLPLETVHEAALKGLNSVAAGEDLEVQSGASLEDLHSERHIRKLLNLVTTGRSLGATHIVAA